MKTAKLLISLRVHLSTAKLTWIVEFLDSYQGAEALGTLLASLVGKAGKRRTLNEVERYVLLETVKCLMMLHAHYTTFNYLTVFFFSQSDAEWQHQFTPGIKVCAYLFTLLSLSRCMHTALLHNIDLADLNKDYEI